MAKQMAWLSATEETEKLLYLRTSTASPWRPYTAFPEHAVPDYKIRGGSKGYATFQKLLKNGWQLIPSDEAERSVKALFEMSR